MAEMRCPNCLEIGAHHFVPPSLEEPAFYVCHPATAYLGVPPRPARDGETLSDERVAIPGEPNFDGRQPVGAPGCTCSTRAPTVPVYRDAWQHLHPCPHHGANYWRSEHDAWQRDSLAQHEVVAALRAQLDDAQMALTSNANYIDALQAANRQADEEIRALRAKLTRKDKAIARACDIIELGDHRLLASDGPAGGQPPDLSLAEWRELYVTLDAARAASGEDASHE